MVKQEMTNTTTLAREPNRRRVLGAGLALGAAGALGLSGCAGREAAP
jgi:hypothetical protein